MARNALSIFVDGTGREAAPAVLSRQNGAWTSPTTRFGDEVRALAAALGGYGLSHGVCAAVLASEGVATLRSDLAVIVAGGTLVPLAPTLSDDALGRALASSRAVQAIASDERQLARVVALRPDLPALDLVLLMSAMPSERKPPALLVDAAIDVGLASLASDPEQLQRAVAEGTDHTACLLVDSAGGTRPVLRAALLSLAEVIGHAVDIAPEKRMLTALPVGGAERLAAALAALSHGASLLLPDPTERPDAGLDKCPADIVFLDVPTLERMFRGWLGDIDAKSWVGRRLTRWALEEGRTAERLGFRHRVADRLGLKPLRAKLGGKVEALDVFVDAGRGAPSEIDSFFTATGLQLRYFSPGPPTRMAR